MRTSGRLIGWLCIGVVAIVALCPAICMLRLWASDGGPGGSGTEPAGTIGRCGTGSTDSCCDEPAPDESLPGGECRAGPSDTPPACPGECSCELPHSLPWRVVTASELIPIPVAIIHVPAVPFVPAVSTSVQPIPSRAAMRSTPARERLCVWVI